MLNVKLIFSKYFTLKSNSYPFLDFFLEFDVEAITNGFKLNYGQPIPNLYNSKMCT